MGMAKSKNHTNHNQSRKNHRNGIQKPRKLRYPSMRGVDQRYIKNLRLSKKANELAKRNPVSYEEQKQRAKENADRKASMPAPVFLLPKIHEKREKVPYEKLPNPYTRK